MIDVVFVYYFCNIIVTCIFMYSYISIGVFKQISLRSTPTNLAFLVEIAELKSNLVVVMYLLGVYIILRQLI